MATSIDLDSDDSSDDSLKIFCELYLQNRFGLGKKGGNCELDSEVVNHLLLNGVKNTDRELGKGAFGRVFEVEYNGTKCAAKQPTFESKFKELFLRECLLHSKLDHPNIVKMLGVYYLSEGEDVPALVMELMEYSLTTLLHESQDIPMYVKL